MLYKEVIIPFKLCKDSKSYYKFCNILFYICCFFLFLTCSNIFGFQKYYNILFSLAAFAYIIVNGKIIIDIRFCLATIFSFSYMLCCLLNNGFHLNFVFYPLLILLLQQFIFSLPTNVSERHLLAMLFSSALGFFISFCLIILASIKHQGFLFNGGYLTTFWKNEEGGIMNRTGLSLYGVGALSFSFSLLFGTKKWKTMQSVTTSLLTIFFITAMSLVATNRSLVVVIILSVFGFGIGLILKSKSKTVSTITIVTLCAAFAILFAVFTGILKMPDSFYQIPIIRRFLSSDYNSDSERLKLYKIFFTNFYKYPFGGLNNLTNFTHVHNIFLDIYTYGGLIPFVIFIMFVVDLFRMIFFISKKERICKQTLLLFISYIVFTFGLGLFEPIYNANPNVMTPVFLFYFYMIYKVDREKQYFNKNIHFYELRI